MMLEGDVKIAVVGTVPPEPTVKFIPELQLPKPLLFHVPSATTCSTTDLISGLLIMSFAACNQQNSTDNKMDNALYRLKNLQSRAASAENPTAEPGKGGNIYPGGGSGWRAIYRWRYL